MHGTLIRAGLIDELHLTISPKIFGGRTAPTIADGIGAPRLAQAARLSLKSMKRIGDELFLVYTVIRGLTNTPRPQTRPRALQAIACRRKDFPTPIKVHSREF